MMKFQHTRRGETQKKNYKNHCHSRMLLSGIPTAINNAQGGDPQLQASGMTTNLNNPSHGEAANFNAPSTWRERAECASTGVRGKIEEEALNLPVRRALRAPLRSGFTLIELLVVILIIGILAAVALPQYQKAVERSKAMQGLTLLKTLTAAYQAAYLANGNYPSSFAELDIDFPLTGNEHFLSTQVDSKSNSD